MSMFLEVHHEHEDIVFPGVGSEADVIVTVVVCRMSVAQLPEME